MLLFITILGSFSISLLLTGLFIKHKFGIDISTGPQKFHKGFIPRVGGLSIFISFTLATLFFYFKTNQNVYIYLIISGIFPFLAGFLEDITKNIAPIIRLILISLGAILFPILSGIYIPSLGIPFLDRLEWLKKILTPFAIAGLSNAINIIDGFNGLAGGISIFILSSMAVLGHLLNDSFVLNVSLTLIAAILGFLIWNFPFGKIFLGDGGAYFIGFVIAILAIYLPYKHPEISPWYSFAILIYPVFEVIFSFYRKKLVRKRSPFLPDRVHFHMLIYNRLLKHSPIVKRSKLGNYRNPLTSIVIWFLYLPFVVSTTIFYKNGIALIIISMGFVCLYLVLYKKMIIKIRK